MKFAVHLFPQFEPSNEIEAIRRRFDPLYGKIPPHLTLVFPFDAASFPERAWEAVRAFRPFHLECTRLEKRGDFLFLLPDAGKQQAAALHDRLYSTAFAPFYAPWIPYEPHITLGAARLFSRKRIWSSPFMRV